ncbi:hypothetical protein [Lacunimicrobium album]
MTEKKKAKNVGGYPEEKPASEPTPEAKPTGTSTSTAPVEASKPFPINADKK